MAVTDTLARDNGAVDIKVAGVWVPIGGINSWSPSPTLNKADTSKFSNQGNLSHLPVSKGMSITLTGFRQVDHVTGDRDPGQVACENLMEQLGPDGIAEFRHSRAGGKVTVFKGSCTVTDGGGGNDDPDAWSVTIERSGIPTTTTTTAVPAAVTSVAGTGGDDHVLIDWTDGSPAGDMFEVTIYDGAVPVLSMFSSEHPVYVPLDADSYTAKVRAMNNSGWSAQSAASASFTVT